jgi:asparagine synthase (glutamine-hydrolysing)
MCGIAGSTLDPSGVDAKAMAIAMVHRGPDDEGVYVDGESGVSLGARRLAVIDVEGGHQPIANEDQTVWAVLNGEIYNNASLRRLLIRAGHKFSSRTDTEVLVHLYEEWGDELVHAIEGMYAFAVWDTHRRTLLLGRDRFGEKPLFYTEQPERLMFASELTALRAGMRDAPPLDPVAMDSYFVLGYIPGQRTAFEGIRQLEPASVLRWSHERLRAECSTYWRPPPPIVSRTSVRDCVHETRALLESAVAGRLVADVPVGIFLSGGLDSNIVAAMAADRSCTDIQTFTVVYDTGRFNEGVPARAAAARISSDHHEVMLRRSDVGELVPRLVGALDQPLADPAMVPLNFVAAAARERVTVVLGGEGADEVFGGYPRYRWMERLDRAQRLLPGPARQVAAFATQNAGERTQRFGNALGHSGLAERHLDWVATVPLDRRPSFYGPRLAEALRSRAPLDDVAGILAAEDRPSVADSLMRLDQRRYLPDNVLAKADRATMQVSLEMRTPYLDRSLVEFAATIPAATHLQNGGKSLLRGVAESMVTIDRSRRSKTAFRVPVDDWLRGPLRDALIRQAQEGPLVTEGWLDPRALRRLTDEHLGLAHDHGKLLWPILVGGEWLEALRRGDGSATHEVIRLPDG